MRHLVKLYEDFRRAVELSQRSGKKGFTLVELLIVIAIIAILAAIAIPQFSKYKQRAYVAAMMNDAHNIIAMEESYYADKNKYLICNDDKIKSDTANYHVGYCNATGIYESKTDKTPLLFFSQDVSLKDDKITSETCSGGVPGYSFTLKHAKTTTTVSYNSCTDKAPHQD